MKFGLYLSLRHNRFINRPATAVACQNGNGLGTDETNNCHSDHCLAGYRQITSVEWFLFAVCYFMMALLRITFSTSNSGLVWRQSKAKGRGCDLQHPVAKWDDPPSRCCPEFVVVPGYGLVPNQQKLFKWISQEDTRSLDCWNATTVGIKSGQRTSCDPFTHFCFHWILFHYEFLVESSLSLAVFSTSHFLSIK